MPTLPQPLTTQGELAARLGPLLVRRATELQQLLDARLAAACGASSATDGVTDPKDQAATESELVVDEAAAESATLELSQVTAARRRIADGSYGFCQQCGNAVDEARLAAIPAAALCTACQAAEERQQEIRHRRRILRLAKRGA